MKNNWAKMSLDAYEASKLLHHSGHYRSAISRAYYAACSAMVAELSDAKGIRFGHGGTNPSHAKLPLMIKGLDDRVHAHYVKMRMKQTLTKMRSDREKADYVDSWTANPKNSLQSVFGAKYILEALGIGRGTL